MQWRCRLRLLPSSAFVTDAGSIVLQMPRNRKVVTQKEKKIIEAYALSQNVSCFETVARVILLLTLKGVGETIILRNVTFMMQCTKEDSGARLVNPWIMEQKTNFYCAGYIIPLPIHFLPSFFLRLHEWQKLLVFKLFVSHAVI